MTLDTELRSRCCAAPVHSEKVSADVDGEFREFIVTASGTLRLGEAMTFVCEDCDGYCQTVEVRLERDAALDDPLTWRLHSGA